MNSEAHIVARARKTLTYCHHDLKLARLPTLCWFDAAAGDSPYTLGMYNARRNEIWLSYHLSFDRMAHTVAHECRHAHQYQVYPADHFKLSDSPVARQWCENDANQYAGSVIAR